MFIAPLLVIYLVFLFVLEVLDCFTEIMKRMEMYKSKLHECEVKLEEETDAQQKTLDETQKLRARLEECQVMMKR